jgi:hypothetical protein
MVWKRFDEIWGNLTFSHQPEERPDNVSSETYWWQCMKGFVDRFNKHRGAQQIVPSNSLCVDESTARWYGKGGYWINHRLPQYVVIDQNPEADYEIQNTACGHSGNMLRLKLVKTAPELLESAHAEVDVDAAPIARATQPKHQTCWKAYMCVALQ